MMYCKKCGGKLESYASNCAFCGTPVEKYDTNVNYIKEEKDQRVKHMNVIKWLGLWLLPIVPVIGVFIWLILMCAGIVAYLVMNPEYIRYLLAQLEALAQ